MQEESTTPGFECRLAFIGLRERALIEPVAFYPDIEEAHAAAGRLAEERG
jgi:hypothetical protein